MNKIMKRLVAVALICVLVLSVYVPAFAESGQRTVYFYAVNVKNKLDHGNYYDETADFMIIPESNEVYIKAESLKKLTPTYDFKYSRKDCAFSDPVRGHTVYFRYGAVKTVVYQSKNPLSYDLPYSPKYIDEVAWIPFDFGMNLLNVAYCIGNDGYLYCSYNETVLGIAHRILKGEFEFNYATDLGYDEKSMKSLIASAGVVYLLDGILKMNMRCWAALLPICDDMLDQAMAEKVCDEFVKVSQAETDVYLKYGKNSAFVADVSSLFLTSVKEGTRIFTLSDYLKLYEHLAEKATEVTTVANGHSQQALIKNTPITRGEILDAALESTFSDFGKMDTPNVLSIIGYCNTMLQTEAQLRKSDEVATRALKRYGENTSSVIAPTVKQYARYYSKNDQWNTTLDKFFAENGTRILVDCINLGPGTAFLAIYNMVSEFWPGMQQSKSFSHSIVASNMQYDVQNMLSENYRKSFSNKKLDEKYLEQVGMDCYTYLKFSIVAREFAINSIKGSKKIDDDVETAKIARLESENKEAARMLSALSGLQEGSGKKVDNSNGIYSLLLPSQNKKYIRLLDESPIINEIMNGAGTLIGSSTIESEPEEYVVLTEEQAIEMVRTYINKQLKKSVLTEGMTGVSTYECLGLEYVDRIDVEDENIFDEGYIFETEYCYIIAAYEDEDSAPGLFCVAADGTGAYFCEEDDDGGYSYMPELSLDSIGFGTFFDVLKKYCIMLLNLVRSEGEERGAIPESSSEEEETEEETFETPSDAASLWAEYAATQKTLASMDSKYYNPDDQYEGECTWYVKGRAHEVLGFVPKVSGHAKEWLKNCVDERLIVENDTDKIQENSIAVFQKPSETDHKGHVVFIEKVIYDANGKPLLVYFTECNMEYGQIDGVDNPNYSRYTPGADAVVTCTPFDQFVNRGSHKLEGYLIPKNMP